MKRCHSIDTMRAVAAFAGYYTVKKIILSKVIK
jgi:hypothetical protein